MESLLLEEAAEGEHLKLFFDGLEKPGVTESNPTLGELREAATQTLLEICEDQIERGLATMGFALKRIRDGELYKQQYPNFETYCRKRWNFSDERVSQLIKASDVLLNFQRIGLQNPTIVGELPSIEGHIRPLTKLEDTTDQVLAWNRAQEKAQGTKNGKVTAALVTEAMQEVKQEAMTRAPAPKPEFKIIDQGRISIAERTRITPPQFNRTNDSIEWALWSWNPVTGCLHDCDYCYARDIAQNAYYAQEYPTGFKPTFRPDRLPAPRHMKVPEAAKRNIGERNVFVCSMADLFGKWVPQEWIDAVFAEVRNAPDWNFLFLTKFPQRLAEIRWPANAWVGTTVDTQARVKIAETAFRGVQAGVKWLSCEPMMEQLSFTSLEMFDWVVIGGASKSTRTPEWRPPFRWTADLVRQADAAGCKVYMKTNLGIENEIRLREYPTESIHRDNEGG